jgi:poly-gamma-glutamate capsule biosynthesis protein CapA/YwtB (metallophosphatase superfamily)
VVTAGGDLQIGGRSSAAQLAELAVLDGDLRFANLEGPLTTRGSEDEGAQKFAARPERAAALRGRLDVLSLANNHALDQGVSGREDTRRALRELGITGVVTQARVKGVTFLARDFAPSADLDAETELVEAVRRAPRPVMISLHWGHTGSLLPTGAQRRLAARLVDAGAVAVLGHGPHTPQGVERRGRAVIAYSLGNLAFSCPCTDARDAYLLRFRIWRDAVEDVRILPLRAGLGGAPPQLSDDAGLRELLDELSHDLAARPGG